MNSLYCYRQYPAYRAIETISDILKIKDEIVKRIKYDLKSRYTSGMIKRVEIPKGDGEYRPLGIPNIYDRPVQLCFKQILEPIVEKSFHKNSFGFRPQRSAECVFEALEILKNDLLGFAPALRSWYTNWSELSHFFNFPMEIRKMIYTTPIIESF